MTPSRLLRLLLPAALAVLALPAAAPAAPRPTANASYVPGEVIVRYERSAGRSARAAVQRTTGVGGRGARVGRVADDDLARHVVRRPGDGREEHQPEGGEEAGAGEHRA